MSVEIAESFFSTLFHPVPVNNRLRFEIRCIQNCAGTTFTPPKRSFFPVKDFGYHHAAMHCMKMREDHDVYVGVLPRIGEHGMSEAVAMAPWLFSDVDGGEEGPNGAVELVKAKSANLLSSNLVVRSGNGLHVYWGVWPTYSFGGHEDRRLIAGYLKRLVVTIGGKAPSAHADPSCADIARILRVPETFNHKRQKTVKWVRNVPGSYPLEAWDALLHPIPEPRPINGVVDWKFNGSVPQGIQRWAEIPYPEGKRHKGFVAAAAWLVRDLHMPKHVVEDLLMTKAQRSIGSHPVSEEEIRSIVKWA